MARITVGALRGLRTVALVRPRQKPPVDDADAVAALSGTLVPMTLPVPRGPHARHARSRGRRSTARRVTTSIIGPVAVVLVVLAVFGVVGGRSGVTRLLGLADSDAARQSSPEAVFPATPPARTWVRPRSAEPTASRASTGRWHVVLHRLDRARARAWRLGEPRLLRAVYTPRATALGADRQLLGDYARRGLRVRHVRLEFDRVRVVERRPVYVRLRVVDRLADATAVSSTGRLLRLPRDRATRHRIVLRRVGGRWRIDAVAAV
jgi:hypothetical protein